MKMASSLKTQILGYPRIGANRELKKTVEAFWKNDLLQESDLLDVGKQIRKQNWLTQQQAGIDLIPSNDFSFYDQILDVTCMVGNVPPRFNWDGKDNGSNDVDLNLAFAIARGAKKDNDPTPVAASDMTKWFDTNYHYIVPEFHSRTTFRLSSSKVFDEFAEALEYGIQTKPVLIGPVTYLSLGKVHDMVNPDFDKFSLLDGLLAVYEQVLNKLAALGAEWIQLDEPIFAQDLSDVQQQALAKTYKVLRASVPSTVKLMVTNYFGPLEANLDNFISLPVDVLHVDCTRTPIEELAVLRQAIKEDSQRKRILSLGVVDGRNIWKADLVKLIPEIQQTISLLGADRVIVSSSCSLLHVPVTLQHEKKVDTEIKGWLAFAQEKLDEIVTLATAAVQPDPLSNAGVKANHLANEARRSSQKVHRPDVQQRLQGVTSQDSKRHSAFPIRQKAQRERLQLPLLPTTTIGSFPQTAEVRAARAQWKNGSLATEAYEEFLRKEIQTCVRFQEEVDIDMLVHGEFERNDMVEYFGEHLEGYVFTSNGWVQSYGSRCVKPPIIFGDIVRPYAITVRWTEYAQSLTSRCMKGMLSGPITMLQWSFVRDDQPRKTTAMQIALALRDEVTDLEAADIAAIQIDEPAIREGLPLRRKDWAAYLDWAVTAFRITASGVRDDTQIHTHMCYSEFNDIIEAVALMDADVITIETSRSNMELLNAFVTFQYPLEIGRGVYDIHSPRVPSMQEMLGLMERAIKVLPLGNLWVNPDCGLKTRGWKEVKLALTDMVNCAKVLRAKYESAQQSSSSTAKKLKE